MKVINRRESEDSHLCFHPSKHCFSFKSLSLSIFLSVLCFALIGFPINQGPKTTKVQGKNRMPKIAALKSAEKFDTTFYHNRTVDKNQNLWSRHLGIVKRNCDICPVRVQYWSEISQVDKNHMWDIVKGRKHGNPPDATIIFFETRKNDENIVEKEAFNKYEELLKTSQSEPTLTNFEVIEKCCGA
ncbi:hypothetical protein Sjap_017887 [Stephania japonica]|uniref:Uncharacterized protein n=1 Tax=Stephania japonica TaxID=461633 RepID=A0AAP0I713_9MAGN